MGKETNQIATRNDIIHYGFPKFYFTNNTALDKAVTYGEISNYCTIGSQNRTKCIKYQDIPSVVSNVFIPIPFTIFSQYQGKLYLTAECYYLTGPSAGSIKTAKMKIRVGDSFVTNYVDIPAKTSISGTLYVAATGDMNSAGVITTNPYLVRCNIEVKFTSNDRLKGMRATFTAYTNSLDVDAPVDSPNNLICRVNDLYTSLNYSSIPSDFNYKKPGQGVSAQLGYGKWLYSLGSLSYITIQVM